jgi:diguanylate cyclase (GGDEF)-like protein
MENIMNLALRIDNNVVAIIASIIFIINISKRLDKRDKSNLVFRMMIFLNTIVLIVETLSCITNKQPYSWLLPISYILNMMLFILGPIIISMWCLFAYLWVNKSSDFKWQKNILILIPLIINEIVVLVNPIYNTVFVITDNNIYHRGSAYIIFVLASYFYLAFGLLYIYRNREKISKVEYLPLLLFGVFPALGGLIQSIFYGFLLIWSTIAFSLIILYLYLQQHMMQIDNLTGAWTRDKLYGNLSGRISQNKNKSFSIVFIDLDNFKQINDKYGHLEGDLVLKNVVELINNTLRNRDSIARYGGDEFVLMLDVEKKEDVEVIMKRISYSFRNFNENSKKPYKLSYSYGFELYDHNKNMNVDQYINHVDKLMFKAKNDKKVKM